MQRIIMLFVSLMAIFLSACGGSSSGSSSSDPEADDGPSEPVVNAAEQANGGSATANYDSANADLVNDGDTNSATFWAGNATGDYVTVEFDGEYQLGEIVIYTNRTNNTDTEIQLSTDGTTFESIALANDCQLGFSLGNGQISCFFHPEEPATHIRVKITDPSTPGSVEIHEIVAKGFSEQ